jgi:hypothetical protein
MEPVCLPLGLVAIALLALLGVGAIILVKLGVLVKYATKEEPPDPGNYHLGQSREPDQQ